MNICIILSNITLSGDTPSLKSEKRAAWNSEYYSCISIQKWRRSQNVKMHAQRFEGWKSCQKYCLAR